jgi:hypothetical protein
MTDAEWGIDLKQAAERGKLPDDLLNEAWTRLLATARHAGESSDAHPEEIAERALEHFERWYQSADLRERPLTRDQFFDEVYRSLIDVRAAMAVTDHLLGIVRTAARALHADIVFPYVYVTCGRSYRKAEAATWASRSSLERKVSKAIEVLISELRKITGTVPDSERVFDTLQVAYDAPVGTREQAMKKGSKS